MHAEALDWVKHHATDKEVVVLEIGGRNINGTPREAFPNAEWTSVDLQEGKDVDVVADAATWEPDREYDVVVCTQVLEHTPDWPALLRTAYKALRKSGKLIATMSGPGYAPHSTDGRDLREGEYYMNIEPDDLEDVLTKTKFTKVKVNKLGTDLRCVAWR